MKKLIAFILSFIVLVMSVSVIPSNLTYAATQEELEAEIDRLNDEIKSNQSKLNKLAKEKEKNKEYLNTLESQISTTEKKADALETQIQTIDTEISKYDSQLKQLRNEVVIIEDEIKLTSEEIKSTEKKIDDTKDDLSSKLRTAYINGKQSTFKILMGSTSLASFLTRLEFMKRTSEDEKKVFNEFKEQTAKLKKAKTKLEEDKSQLDEKKANLETTKAKSVEKKKELTTAQADYKKTVSSLEKNYAGVETYIASLDKSSSAYNDYIKKLEAERQAADAEIDEIIRQAAMTSTTFQETTLYAANANPGSDSGSGSGAKSYSSSDSWAWPLGNASCYISSGYGNRSASISGWSFHGGTDIAGGGIYGKPVYASRSGRVIAAVNGSTGYGKYVIIDHGDGFVTLYGHCSSLNVTTGQYVTKGQHISNVGSTGNVTGPHLHFEVRYNGVKQNPMNYVKKP